MRQFLKREALIFLSAVMFFSRLPVFRFFEDAADYRNNHIRYLPLVGILLGALNALAFMLANQIFPKDISIVLSMITGLILTGAFHEDGLADTADGFGGGFTRERVLAIMKDSRIGTYGAVTLICAFGLKFLLLNSLTPQEIVPATIMSAGASRVFPVLLVASACYVSEDSAAKSKFVASHISAIGLTVAVLCGIVPLMFGSCRIKLLLSFISLLAIFVLLRLYTLKRIGGYTGDVLGAFQQIFELLILMNMSWLC
jgi:adenosylcobinamide-GDP ribazoletransferase